MVTQQQHDPRSARGRCVETPAGPGVIWDAHWDAKDRLVLHVYFEGEEGLHVYLARHCRIGEHRWAGVVED